MFCGFIKLRIVVREIKFNNKLIAKVEYYHFLDYYNFSN